MKASSCTRSPCSACCENSSRKSIARHLNPHLRKYLRLAARDLAQHEPDFHKLRSVFAVVPFEVADRTLPTKVNGADARGRAILKAPAAAPAPPRCRGES